MKTKIKTISPDQNIIEHESGLKTVFVELSGDPLICGKCIYCYKDINDFSIPKFLCGEGNEIKCVSESRIDKKDGHFAKLIEP